MTSRMASIAAGALPALKKKCGSLSWQPDCASAPPSPNTWRVGGLGGRPGWWDRRPSPRLTLTLTLTLTLALTSVTSSGSKTVTSCTTLDSDLPTGALLAASVLVTYLGEGGGDEGGGGGLGMGGGGEGGGGLGGVCRWWRWWKSAANRGLGHFALQHAPPACSRSERPPASASLVQSADVFSLASRISTWPRTAARANPVGSRHPTAPRGCEKSP